MQFLEGMRGEVESMDDLREGPIEAQDAILLCKSLMTMYNGGHQPGAKVYQWHRPGVQIVPKELLQLQLFWCLPGVTNAVLHYWVIDRVMQFAGTALLLLEFDS